MRKKLFSLICALCIAVVLTATAAASPQIPQTPQIPPQSNFTIRNIYNYQFTDVQPTDWFAPMVRQVYEFGLMRGSSDFLFSPNNNLTYAQTIALAVRVNSIYITGADPVLPVVQSGQWHEPYIIRAIELGIIAANLPNVNAPARRSDVAVIFRNALPGEAFLPIRDIPDGTIPDVGMSAPYASAVYTLYRAGILSGSDRYGTFNPSSYIRRAEIAAVMARIADPIQRSPNPLNIPVPVVEPQAGGFVRYFGFANVVDFGSFSGAQLISSTPTPLGIVNVYNLFDFATSFEHFTGIILSYQSALFALGFEYEDIDVLTVRYTNATESVTVNIDDEAQVIRIDVRREPRYFNVFPMIVDFGWFAGLSVHGGPSLREDNSVVYSYFWTGIIDELITVIDNYSTLLIERGFAFVSQEGNRSQFRSATHTVAIVIDGSNIFIEMRSLIPGDMPAWG